MAEKQFLVDINLNKNELINARVQNLTTLPVLDNPNTTDLNYIGWMVFLENTGITYILKNINGTATWEPFGSGSSKSVGGGIYLMNIKTTNSEENAYATQSVDGEDITEITTTNKNLKFTLIALSGPTSLKPNIFYKLGGDQIAYQIPSTYIIKDPDRPTYNITDYQIDLTGYSSITFMHEDGAYRTININNEELPLVTSAIFTPIGTNLTSYPNNQTELAAGNQIQITVTSNSIINKITVYNEDACIASVHNFSNNQTSQVITVTAADRGTTTQNLGAVLTVTKPGGSTSAKFYTNGGSNHTDGINYMKLNNLFPILSSHVITYPNNYSAISNTTSASVNISINNLTDLQNYTILYDSPLNQLNIPNTTTYEASKIITTSWTGYDISGLNYRVVVKKTSNGNSVTKTLNVAIASKAPTITITLPAQRLISDVSPGKLHVITINSDQKLNSVSLNTGTNGGIWNIGSSFSSTNGLIWTNSILISDDLTKGDYSWNGLYALNIAGVSSTTISSGANYTIGGFTPRTLSLGVGLNTVLVPVATTESSTDNTKCRAIVTWKGTLMDNQYPIGTAAPTDANSSKPGNTWAVSNILTNPFELRLLNYGATQASSQVTTIVIEEPA